MGEPDRFCSFLIIQMLAQQDLELSPWMLRISAGVMEERNVKETVQGRGPEPIDCTPR